MKTLSLLFLSLFFYSTAFAYNLADTAVNIDTAHNRSLNPQTAVGDPGLNTNLVSEKAVRDAVKAIEGSGILSTGETGGTKFLREDGDNTSSWQTVTIEGTAVSSTGETGGIKFLREDGDGTSSWQTVTGGASASTDLTDFSATAPTTTGEVPTWNSVTGEYEPGTPSGSGDVIGPASATDSAMMLSDGTTGKLLKSGQTTEDASGNVTVAGTLTSTGVITAPGFSSSAPEGEHMTDDTNTVAITAPPTEGRRSYLTDRVWVANGTDWTSRWLIENGAVTGNTETGIAVTAQSDGTIDFVVDTSATTETLTNKTISSASNTITIKDSYCVALSDEDTDITVGTARNFPMPYAFTVTDVVLYALTTQPVGSVISVDINEEGVSILSTEVTIDAGEKNSSTAATPPVISDSSIAQNADMSADITAVGSTTAGAGLKLCFNGTRSM